MQVRKANLVLVIVAGFMIAGCGKRPGRKQDEQHPSPNGDDKPVPTGKGLTPFPTPMYRKGR